MTAILLKLTLSILLCGFIGGCHGGKRILSSPYLSALPSDGPRTVNIDCGGVLTDSIGSIAYKHEEPLAPNERCVWIIRPSDVSHYQLSVYSMGFPAEQNDTRLIIVGLSTDSSEDKLHLVPREPEMLTFPNRQVLIVVFYTGEDVFIPTPTTEETTDPPTTDPPFTGAPSTYPPATDSPTTTESNKASSGFFLQYVGTRGSLPSLGSGSKNLFLSYTGEVDILRYPDHRGNYSNNEITTFVFNSGGVYNEQENIEYRRVIGGIQPSCRDTLIHYTLSPSRAVLNDQPYCDSSSSGSGSFSDLGFFVFKSDDSVTDRGFTLAWRVNRPDDCV